MQLQSPTPAAVGSLPNLVHTVGDHGREQYGLVIGSHPTIHRKHPIESKPVLYMYMDTVRESALESADETPWEGELIIRPGTEVLQRRSSADGRMKPRGGSLIVDVKPPPNCELGEELKGLALPEQLLACKGYEKVVKDGKIVGIKPTEPRTLVRVGWTGAWAKGARVVVAGQPWVLPGVEPKEAAEACREIFGKGPDPAAPPRRNLGPVEWRLAVDLAIRPLGWRPLPL